MRKVDYYGLGVGLLGGPISLALGSTTGAAVCAVAGIALIVMGRLKNEEEGDERGGASIFHGIIPSTVEVPDLVAASSPSAHPDIALVWELTDDQKRALKLIGDLDKTILVHNRSGQYIYNVQIGSLRLSDEMLFEQLNEIAPNDKRLAIGRWNGTSTSLLSYIFFFGDDANERQGEQLGWRKRKSHNRGISGWVWDIPMTLSYESPVGTKWKDCFEFHYDPGDVSTFTKRQSAAEIQGSRNSASA